MLTLLKRMAWQDLVWSPEFRQASAQLLAIHLHRLRRQRRTWNQVKKAHLHRLTLSQSSLSIYQDQLRRQ